MTTHDQPFASGVLARGGPAAPLPNWIKAICPRLTAWAVSCADYCAAAAMYDQLSALSDVQLARRGLSRATLAHDVHGAYDRNAENGASCAAAEPSDAPATNHVTTK